MHGFGGKNKILIMKNNWNGSIAKPLININDAINEISSNSNNKMYYNDVLFLLDTTEFTFDEILNDLEKCNTTIILTQDQYKNLKKK